jgi:hypothetical protein
MKLERIKFSKGRPYIEYKKQSGRQEGQSVKIYGQIIKCKTCGDDNFVQNNDLKRGYGEYCSIKCSNWTGGKINKDGYIGVFDPLHPSHHSRNYVYEHRLVVEKQIGRFLHRWEIVYHMNGIKDDNRIQNLMVLKDEATHRKIESGKNIKPENIIFDGRIYNNIKNNANI